MIGSQFPIKLSRVLLSLQAEADRLHESTETSDRQNPRAQTQERDADSACFNFAEEVCGKGVHPLCTGPRPGGLLTSAIVKFIPPTLPNRYRLEQR